MKVIEVKNISKTYTLGTAAKDSIIDSFRTLFQSTSKVKTTFDALKDISFDVNKGEVLGIVGKNGAGKSTLLKILSRITEPTSGEIIMRGRVASLLEVGTGFHPELSGRENIFLNGSILGMTRSEIKSKFDEIVAFSGVEKFIDTAVKHYSSGMYVRLAFSVAAHLEPEVLIIDEVLAVGDAEFQKKCLGKMKDVAGEGRTVLFVSHNMAAVKSLCTRVVLLENGKLVANSQEVEDIIQYYSKQGKESQGTSSFVSFKSKPNSILELGLKDEKSNLILNSTNLIFRVKFHLEFPKGADLNIAFFTAEHQKLFVLLGKEINGGDDFKVGENELVFTLPKNILNKGKYYINISMHKNYSEFLFARREAFYFTIEESTAIYNKYPNLIPGPINLY
jgi:lipopolysaccharide transport system ATP-binding protein